MPLYNEVDVNYLDQSEIDAGNATQWEAIADGYHVVRVLGVAGGAVTAQTVPNGTVAVSAGTGRLVGSNGTITAGNVSVLSGAANPDGSTGSVASATEARFSLITFNSSSQLGVLHGDEAELSDANDGSYDAIFPAFAGKLLLAAVFIPPGVTTVASGMIKDLRVIGNVNAFHDQLHTLSSSTSHTGDMVVTQMPQLAAFSAYANPTSSTADPLTTYIPYTDKTWTIDGVLPASLAGTKRWRNRTGRTLTFDRVELEVSTAPTTQAILVDVNVDGTTIWSAPGNRANIQAGQTNGAQTTFNTTTIATGSYLSLDLDQAGTGTTGANLAATVWMKG